MSKSRIGLAAVASVASLALGVGTATAGSGHAHHAKAHAAKVAGLRARGAAAGELKAASAYLGLPPSQLRADLKAGQTLAQVADATTGKSADGLVATLTAAAKTKLDTLVAAGKLTSAQETKLLARLSTRIDSVVHGVHAGRHAVGGMLAAGLKVASGYLGVTPAQLKSDLEAGQTLAQVAAATPGRSADGLVAALMGAAKTKLDAAVASGKLTSVQESALLTRLTSLVGAVVNG